MIAVWIAVSIALYLVPVVVYVLGRVDAQGGAWRVSLDVAVILALDLLSILVLARFVTLETAVLASRVVWLGVAPWLLWRRRAEIRSAWRLARAPMLLLAATAVALAVAISLTMSVPYAVWDREWHIPLVASLRGQRVPFWNVFESGGRLNYHYSGDVLAACFQILSFDHMHTSNALSRAHDVIFGLLGLLLACLLPSFGIRRSTSALAVIGASVLAGSATLLQPGDCRPDAGYSYPNMLQLSFRPHVPLAYILIFGFVGAMFLPVVSERRVTPERVRPALFATTALLTLTDEVSLLLLGLMIGTLWLTFPQVVAKTRIRGAAVLACLGAVIGVVILLFGGTFGHGGQRQVVTIVPWQSPGFAHPTLSLSEPIGLRMVFIDLLLVFGTFAAGCVAVAVNPRRDVRATYVAYAVMAVVSCLAFTRLNVNGTGLECHRFVTPLVLLTPFFAFFWMNASGGTLWAARGRAVIGALAFLAITPGVLSTVEWLVGPAVKGAALYKNFWGNDNFYSTDCRELAAAHIGETPRPTYVAQNLWYAFAGCRPIFAPGPKPGEKEWRMLIGLPDVSTSAVARLGSWVRPSDPVPAFCFAAGLGDGDPVCSALRSRGACQRATALVEACVLSPEARQSIALGH